MCSPKTPTESRVAELQNQSPFDSCRGRISKDAGSHDDDLKTVGRCTVRLVDYVHPPTRIKRISVLQGYTLIGVPFGTSCIFFVWFGGRYVQRVNEDHYNLKPLIDT